MSNSARGSEDEEKLKHPGRRSGEGAESVLPYLQEDLASRPQELTADQPAARRSLASRMRAALARLRR